jgi:hypothetical protein
MPAASLSQDSLGQKSTKKYKRREKSVLHCRRESKPTPSEEDQAEVFVNLTVYHPTSLPTLQITCPGCQSFVDPGSLFSPTTRFCHYFGQFYCRSCHTGMVTFIPAWMIRKGNFTKLPVCDYAFQQIEDAMKEPIIDLSLYNAELYEDRLFHNIRKLREKMMIQNEYINTCKKKDQLLRVIGPKKHFFDTVHIYSLSDLIEANEGVLLPKLQQMVDNMFSHITKCEVCSAKGFICDICNSNEIIFPFELQKVSRCGGCGQVFHRRCVEENRAKRKNCPVCERLLSLNYKSKKY